MKSIIGIIALILITSTIYGKGTIDTQPQLKVMAKSGLKLRISPSTDAPVLDVINYGELVTKTEDFVESRTKFTVNWVEGSWIKVNYNNQIGFIFDGFVSELSVPISDGEFASSINDLGFALYSWSHNSYELSQTDTLTHTDMALTTVSTLGSSKLFLHETEYATKVELTMENIRIMDLYHLMESMMDTRDNRNMFKENTVFYSGKDGKVNKLKIAGGQVTIRDLGNGQIKISCQTIHEGC